MPGSNFTDIKPASSPSGWSNRIVLLALLGIFFLTLYPFHFAAHSPLPPGRHPFMLNHFGKFGGALDVILNILLFIPFGFGLSERLRERGWSRKETFLTTWVAGALLSYCVEFAQLYIPGRDSGWQDILTNSSGSAVGAAIFLLVGVWLVGFVANLESQTRRFLTLRRAALILLVYLGLWFVLSAALQRDTRLSNWSPQSHLFVGGVSPPKFSSGWIQTWYSAPWKGTVSQLQLWNRAVPPDVAQALTAGEAPDAARVGLLASYDFSSSTPLDDQAGFLPPFTWVLHPPRPPSSPIQIAAIDNRSWLGSSAPVANFVEDVQKTNQFSLRVVCTPAEALAVDERIVSIVQPSGVVDLHLGQDSAHLILWFRNSISAGHAAISWNIPDTFVAGQQRDILFAYDGSNLSLYVNGSKNRHPYALGPGARVAELAHRIRTSDLAGYNDAYNALIFFSGGALLGLAAFRKSPREVSRYSLVAVGLLLPPYIYERILSQVSGRPLSFESVLLCVILSSAGFFWINADRLPD